VGLKKNSKRTRELLNITSNYYYLVGLYFTNLNSNLQAEIYPFHWHYILTFHNTIKLKNFFISLIWQKITNFISGIGGSGKSTVCKQLRIIYDNGFSTQELQDYRQLLQLNVLKSMKALVQQVRKLGLKVPRVLRVQRFMNHKCYNLNWISEFLFCCSRNSSSLSSLIQSQPP
jgi:hypothetical protein